MPPFVYSLELSPVLPALTKAGFQRMAAAHAIGREAVIIVNDIVIFHYALISPMNEAYLSIRVS